MIDSLLTRLRLRKPVGDFERSAQQFIARCKRWPLQSVSGNGPRVGVLITPWLQTAVPFFSLEIARELARAGLQPVLLWDTADVFGNIGSAEDVEVMKDTLEKARESLQVIDVAECAPDATEPTEFVDQLLYENAVRELRGEASAEHYVAENQPLADAMRTHAQRVSALLQREKFDWVLIPGGVWAVSGVWTHIAQVRDVPQTTYDSGVGTLFFAQGGAAAHFADVAETYREIAPKLSPEKRASLAAKAREALAVRTRGEDEFRLQPHAAGSRDLKYDLLVPLNYRSDTAALHRQRAFASVTDWLSQLLRWVGEKPDLTIAIRQHPCERIPAYRGTDAWKEILAPFQAQLGSRMRFVAAEDPVNTYDLLASCRVVLPWTSRIGIEAAMQGKPVLLGTHCYYLGLGITEDAATPESYFAALGDVLDGRRKPAESVREDAAILYYLVEKCLPLRTSFTPQPADYVKWVEQAPRDLWQTPAMQVLRTSLLQRKGVALVQFQQTEAA